MELIVAAVISLVALVCAYLMVRQANDRCERADGTAHSMAITNRELAGLVAAAATDANDRFAKACETLMEVSECAPQRAQLEMQRLTLQYDIDMERLNRMKNGETASRQIESVHNRGDNGMIPVSASMIEEE